MHRLIPNVHGYRRNQTALSYEHRRSVHHSGLAMSWQVYSAQDIPELLFKFGIAHLVMRNFVKTHTSAPDSCFVRSCSSLTADMLHRSSKSSIDMSDSSTADSIQPV